VFKLAVVTKLGILTVRAADWLTLPTVAWTVVWPLATPLAKPVLLTVTTLGFDEIQVVVRLRSWVLLSLNFPIAVSCCVVLTKIEEFSGVIAIDARTITVKCTSLLGTPFTVTTTGPLVAPDGVGRVILLSLQLDGVATIPLNVAVLVPWADPKVCPVIVTANPTGPDARDKFVMLGVGSTVKLKPLLVPAPNTVTTTLPVGMNSPAPYGTGTVMLVVLQLVGAALTPPNVIKLLPWDEPKFVPVSVTNAPIGPDIGDRLVMQGAATTVNTFPLLFTPLAYTTTLPVVAPDGTVTAMLVAVQVVTLAVTPLNLTVPLSWDEPKFVPLTVTAAPTVPVPIDRLVMLGAATTVNPFPLLFTPLANTITFPVVAPDGTVTAMLVAVQVVTLAVAPLNLTVPLPCGDPKFIPMTATAAPTAPDVIDWLVMLGVATTVKFTPLLLSPPTSTTTFPIVAPVGTVVTMLVVVQVVTLAVIPLNLTVLARWAEPKLVPVIVTVAPTAPDVIDKLVMPGATAKLFPLLFTAPATTTTLPLVAVAGTVVTMVVAVHVVAVAVVPLNLILPIPWGEPKFVPVMIKEAPTAPVVIDKLLMVGAAAWALPEQNSQRKNATTRPTFQAFRRIHASSKDTQ
jgi:hypothetical protein